MSKETYVISSSLLSALQKKAKALKKTNNIPHHEALDIIARELRFTNWEHLKKSQKETGVSENAYRNGLLWAMDIKDAEPLETDGISQDAQAQMLILSDFVKLRGGVNEEDQYFLEDLLDMNIFYRYEGKTPNKIQEARDLIQEYFFFSPQYIWLRGEWYDMYGKFDYNEYLAEEENDGFL
jgi:hypothetical protein